MHRRPPASVRRAFGQAAGREKLRGESGGGKGDRTPDLVNAIHALSQTELYPHTPSKNAPSVAEAPPGCQSPSPARFAFEAPERIPTIAAMKILIVGNGGREHALAWKLASDSSRPEICCAPGNAGTAALGCNVPIAAADVDALLAWASKIGRASCRERV